MFSSPEKHFYLIKKLGTQPAQQYAFATFIFQNYLTDFYSIKANDLEKWFIFDQNKFQIYIFDKMSSRTNLRTYLMSCSWLISFRKKRIQNFFDVILSIITHYSWSNEKKKYIFLDHCEILKKSRFWDLWQFFWITTKRWIFLGFFISLFDN